LSPRKSRVFAPSKSVCRPGLAFAMESRISRTSSRADLLSKLGLRFREPAEPAEDVGPQVAEPRGRRALLLDLAPACLLEHRERLGQVRAAHVDLRQDHGSLGRRRGIGHRESGLALRLLEIAASQGHPRQELACATGVLL
jgi:hypothetical protein